MVFAGGSYFKWFPLRGLVSDDWGSSAPSTRCSTISGTWRCRSAPWSIGGFAGLTFLTKNSFIEEIGKQYV